VERRLMAAGLSSAPVARFETHSWDGGRIVVNRDFAPLLSAARLDSFDAVMRHGAGQIVRQVGTRWTTRLLLEGDSGLQALYLKRHLRATLRDRVKPLLSLGWPILGARCEWNSLLRFHALGIPTATPVAVGESAGCSFLITEEIPAGRSLLDWTAPPPGQPGWPRHLMRPMIERVAAIARQMHGAGMHHQDFYLNHLIVCGDPEELDIRVIDLGRVRQTARLGWRWIIKDLAQLDFSARALSCSSRLRFLRLYLGRQLTRADRPLIGRIVNKSRRIALHTQKNGL
jgi:heptose I phosphotransferase